jgi:hypothetical protein
MITFFGIALETFAIREIDICLLAENFVSTGRGDADEARARKSSSHALVRWRDRLKMGAGRRAGHG